MAQLNLRQGGGFEAGKVFDESQPLQYNGGVDMALGVRHSGTG